MMQAMREGVGRWIAILLLAFVGFGFIFFGVDFTTTSATVAARVNGESIAMLEFERVLQPQLTQYQQLYRIELTDDLRREIRANVLENMVRDRVLAQRVTDAGYRASDERVAQSIRSDENFQVGGQFDADIYRTLLTNAGILPEQYEEQERVQLALGDLQGGIVNSTFLTPAEFRMYVELTQQQREVAFASFEVDAFVEGIEVTDEDIAEHYEANGAFYMSEETVDFEYVEVSLADIAANTVVTEEELRDYYESERGLFETEEERRVRHILIDEADDAAANARAEEVLARLDAGESFEDLAAELSDDPGTRNSGGDLGRIVRGMLPGAFEDAVFDMAEGETRGPVRSDFGFHVIRLDSIAAGDTQSFDSVRDDLLSQLRTQRAEDGFYEIANTLGDRAFYAEGDLAEIAAELMLPLVTVDGFGRTGDREMFENSELIVQAAFSDPVLREGRNSDLIELSEGDVMVLRVIEHNLSEQQPLEEVRDLIADELRNGRRYGKAWRYRGAVRRQSRCTLSRPASLSRSRARSVTLNSFSSASRPASRSSLPMQKRCARRQTS
jgi:peptidyl-prolyl cis-trans isomerase D